MPFDLEHDDELVRIFAAPPVDADADEPLHVQPVRLRLTLATSADDVDDPGDGLGGVVSNGADGGDEWDDRSGK